MWVRYSGHDGALATTHTVSKKKKKKEKKKLTACGNKPLVNEIMCSYLSSVDLYLTNKYHQTFLVFAFLSFISRFADHPYQIWWDWLHDEVHLQDITFKWLSTV